MFFAALFIGRLVRLQETRARQGSCLLWLGGRMNSNTNADIARIFAAEQAFPIGPGVFNENSVSPVECTLESCEHRYLSSRDIDRFLFLRFPFIPKTKTQQDLRRFTRDESACSCNRITL